LQPTPKPQRAFAHNAAKERRLLSDWRLAPLLVRLQLVLGTRDRVRGALVEFGVNFLKRLFLVGTPFRPIVRTPPLRE